ncbi:MAG: peptidoglycan bridge formation glycyltransferase FemA/FemB family protein [Candidatus Brennerbacteria bacterium]
MGRNEWNQEITSRGGTFLQSWEWGKLQESLGRDAHCAPETHTLLVSMPLLFGLAYDYAPHGPSGTHLNGEILHDIADHTRSTRTIFLRVEPRVGDTPEARGALLHAGFRKVADVQPSETRFIDLTLREDELLSAMEHDTRYAIRTAEKRGVTIETAQGAKKGAAFAKFWELFEATNARHSLHAYGKRYYEAVEGLNGDPSVSSGPVSCSTEIFLANREGKTIASAITAYFGTQAYYLYAASRAGQGKYNAPSLLLWEIIRSAKARGYKTLDLWGISETKKEWRGVTSFKKSFGGASVQFVGTWDYVYRPLWYFAYRIFSYVR